MSYSRLNPTAESQNALVFKGNLSSTITDLNNATTMGIYFIGNVTMTNAPATYKYRFLIVLESGVVKQQFVFGNMSPIYFRGYTNSAWGAWHTISST